MGEASLVFFSVTIFLTVLGFYLAMKWEQHRQKRHAH
jgi:hypothetical protein